MNREEYRRAKVSARRDYDNLLAREGLVRIEKLPSPGTLQIIGAWKLLDLVKRIEAMGRRHHWLGGWVSFEVAGDVFWVRLTMYLPFFEDLWGWNHVSTLLAMEGVHNWSRMVSDDFERDYHNQIMTPHPRCLVVKDGKVMGCEGVLVGGIGDGDIVFVRQWTQGPKSLIAPPSTSPYFTASLGGEVRDR